MEVSRFLFSFLFAPLGAKNISFCVRDTSCAEKCAGSRSSFDNEESMPDSRACTSWHIAARRPCNDLGFMTISAIEKLEGSSVRPRVDPVTIFWFSAETSQLH